MCDDVTSVPSCKSGFYGFPGIAPAQNSVERALHILPVGEETKCFADNGAFVSCSGLGELFKQAIGLIVEDDLQAEHRRQAASPQPQRSL